MKKKPTKKMIRKAQKAIPKGRAPDPMKMKGKMLPRVSKKGKKSKAY